jgi:hydroxymethylpyrimidine/phosphomethylpyrimidine kinase
VTPRIALTIAGSDSGGGAGIEADLRTFAAHGVHGAVAISAVTAQNTVSVDAVWALEPEMVVTQVTTVTEDLHLHATKAGMLARPGTIAAVGELARRGQLPNLVVDPVLVSSTGYPLMEPGGTDAYRELLIPQALVLTPNLRETAVLLDAELEEFEELSAMADAGKALLAMGARWVVVKGGHFLAEGATAERAPDVVVGPEGVFELEATRIDTRNDHGTGCTLSSAIAANLANGLAVRHAIGQAKSFVHRAIASAAAWELGRGHGPIDQMGWGDASGSAALP